MGASSFGPGHKGCGEGKIENKPCLAPAPFKKREETVKQHWKCEDTVQGNQGLRTNKRGAHDITAFLFSSSAFGSIMFTAPKLLRKEKNGRKLRCAKWLGKQVLCHCAVSWKWKRIGGPEACWKRGCYQTTTIFDQEEKRKNAFHDSSWAR